MYGDSKEITSKKVTSKESQVKANPDKTKDNSLKYKASTI